VGGASANSYVSLADAQAYHELNFGSDAWFDPDGDAVTAQVRALIKAARRLNQENWIGNRVDTTQRLAWPRYEVEVVDSAGYGYVTGTRYYDTTEIPQQIKDAQCELALAYLDGFSEGNDSGAIEKWKADDVEITYRQTRPDGVIPSEVMRLISPLIQGPQLVRS
jgi:hypothetical protein